MKPLVERLEKTYEGKVEFRRLNAETDPSAVELANQLGITAVPTFVLVNSDGVQAGTIIGGQTEQQLTAALDQLK